MLEVKEKRLSSFKKITFIFMLVLLVIGMSASVFNSSAADYNYEIVLNEEKVLQIERESFIYFEFKAEVSASYTFCSVSNFDTMGFLYDSEKNPITSDDDSGENFNFLITHNLEAGKTYFFAMRFASPSTSGEVAFLLTSDAPAEKICSHTNTQTYPGKAATCTDDGYTESIICSECQVWLTEKTTIPATNHPDAYTVPGKAANCLQDGYTDGIYCDDCGTWIVEQQIIEAEDHNFIMIKDVAPTCTEKGEKVYLCYCTETYTEYSDPLEHSYTLSSQIKASYTNEGKDIYSCSRCSDSYEIKNQEMLTLKAVSGLSVSDYDSTSVKIKWNKTDGAEFYIVAYKIKSGDWITVTTDKTSFSFANLAPAREYRFKVRALREGNEGAFSGEIAQMTCPDTAEWKSTASTTSSITLNWNKVSDAKGYRILYSASADFSSYKEIAVGNPETVSAVISSLPCASVYYVKIRSYCVFNGKNIYGKFSDVKKITTLPDAVRWYKTSSAEDTVTLSWYKQSNVTGYEITYSESSAFTGAKTVAITSAKTNKAIIKKLSSATTYYFKIIAFKTVDGKKIYGENSTAISKTTKPPKASLSSTSRDSKYVILSWKKITGATGYQILYSTSSNFSTRKVITVQGASTLSRKISGLNPATTYYFKIRAYKAAGNTNLYGKFSEVKRLTTKPAQVSWDKIDIGVGKIVLTWKQSINADGYQILYSTSSSFKKYKTINVKKGTSLKKTVKNLDVATKYYIKIRAYKTVGTSKVYGDFSTVAKKTTKLGKVSLTGYTVSTSKIAVTWKTVSGADGYQVLYSTSSSFSDGKAITVKGINSLRKTVKNLTSAKSYYIKVRAYKTANKTKIYGDYSSVIKATTKPLSVSVSELTLIRSAKLRITWKNVPNVSGYEISYSTSPDFADSVTITVSGGTTLSRTVKNLVPGKTYYFRIRAYKTVGGKRIYGNFGTAKSIQISP